MRRSRKDSTRQFVVRSLVASLVVVTGLACGPSVTVRYDYDPSLRGVSPTTYQWLGIADDGLASSFDVERVARAVQAELERKGLRRVEEGGAPDLLAAAFLGIRPKRVERWKYSSGVYWTKKTTAVRDASLTVDLIDARRRQLAWRGVVQGPVSRTNAPEKRERNIRRAVRKLLASYPPPSSGD